MSDQVTCVAVLDGSRLYLACAPDLCLRILPIRLKGEPKIPKIERPQWEVEPKGNTLHVQPSLLCLDTKFHTAYNWTCLFAYCQPGACAYDLFYQLNPSLRQ